MLRKSPDMSAKLQASLDIDRRQRSPRRDPDSVTPETVDRAKGPGEMPGWRLNIGSNEVRCLAIQCVQLAVFSWQCSVGNVRPVRWSEQ